MNPIAFRRIVKPSVYTFLFVYLTLLSFSFKGIPIAEGLDESYFAALNLIGETSYRFGHDIETTYGSLGYLCTPINVGSNILQSALLSLVLSAVSALALLRTICFHFSFKEKWMVLLLFALAFFFYSQARDYQLLSSFLVCMICFVSSGEKKHLWMIYSAAAIAGFSVFVKFNNALVMVVDLFAAIAVIAVTNRKILPLSSISLLVFFAVSAFIGLSSFKSVSDVSSFIVNSFDVASAYSLVMSSVDRSVFCLIGAALLFVSLCVFGIILVKEKSRLVIPLILIAVPLLMAFKHSFIREGNICKFPHVALICIALTFLFCQKKRDSIWLTLTVGLLVLFVPARFKECPSGPNPLLGIVGLEGATSIADLINPNAKLNELDALTVGNFEKARLPADWLSQLKNSRNGVDCIPFDVFYCFANHLNWHPNPPIQLAYAISPNLDAWCTKHFADSKAPENILMSFPDCDWRHPFFTAPETWRTIYSNYYSVGLDDKLQQVLIKRRVAPLTEQLEKISQMDFGPENWVPVPLEPDFIVAKIFMKESRIGKIQRALYRVDPIYMDIAYKDATYGYFRFLPNTAPAGILLSPLPKTLNGMNTLFEGKPCPRTTFFKIKGDGLNCFEKRMTVEWYKATYK